MNRNPSFTITAGQRSDGATVTGAWSCGMVVGLINDVPTAEELIDRTMAEAERIIRPRLTGFLDGAEQKPLKKKTRAFA